MPWLAVIEFDLFLQLSQHKTSRAFFEVQSCILYFKT